MRSVGSDLRMDYTAVGQTTHLAARMEQLARPGTTLLTKETLELAEGYVQVSALGSMPVKGLDRPVDVYELSGGSPGRTRLQALAGRGLSRFVGRDQEVEELRRALDRAAGGPADTGPPPDRWRSYSARSLSVKKPGRTWSRDQEKSWTTIADSTRCFKASGSEGYAQRPLANSVAPPSGGRMRAESSEQSDGTGLKELSLCQSILAS